MSSILDLEAWLVQADLQDRHEASALYDAVRGVQASGGFECVAHQASAIWFVKAPQAKDTLILATQVHRDVLLGMLRQRYAISVAAPSRLSGWRLPPHVSAAARA